MKKILLILFILISSCVTPIIKDNGFFIENSNEIYWRTKVPIYVIFDKNVPKKFIATYLLVAKEVNTIIGREVLSTIAIILPVSPKMDTSMNVPSGFIYVTIDNTIGSVGLMDYNNRTDGSMVSCKIRFEKWPTCGLLVNVVKHEIGHCLGLKHDDQSIDSIMVPEIGNNLLYFTEKDQKLLRDRYAIKLK